MNTEMIESIVPRRASQQLRLRFLYVVLILVLGCLLFRGVYLQVVYGASFRERAENNRVYETVMQAPRGIIYDRYGVQLVENVSSTDLVLNPVLLPPTEHEGYLIERLADLVPDVTPEMTAQVLLEVRKKQRPLVLKRALDHETVVRLQAQQEDVLGVELVSSLIRKYPMSQMLAHVLGYTGAVTADELLNTSDLFATDITGKDGLERSYDAELRGVHGRQYVEVNAQGQSLSKVGAAPPVSGQDLQLTLDAEMQSFIYGRFSELEKNKREEDPQAVVAGAAIAIDPRSGEVLSLVNFPSYDANVFSDPSRQAERSKIFEEEGNPLFQRAVDGNYPSGSVIKPFLALAGLEEGIITAQTTFLSTGGISIGPWSFPDWKSGGHGVTDVQKAIAESVNTFFYILAGGYDGHPGLGVTKIGEYLSRLGWGQPTGIDLPSEAAGFLPTEAWKKEVKGEPWYIGDTYHLGIGQGDVLATPLQIAYSTAGLANGVSLFTPHLVASERVTGHDLPFSRQHINTVREGMRKAVTEGSARRLSGLEIPLAGKTGTAQVGGDKPTHAWFTSFGPYEKEELVVVVLLENGGAGDIDAVPFAQEIWGWWISNRMK